MSSHHVIRDEQEPPVFVLSENFDVDILNELLGWAPLLYVESSLYKWFQARNIKVDGIILLEDDKKEEYQGISKYYLNALKDNLLELVLHVINKRSFTAFNLFCDETQEKELIKEARIGLEKHLPFTTFNGKRKTLVTFKTKLVKWLPAGQQLQINANKTTVSPQLLFEKGVYEVGEEGSYTFITDELPLIITEL